MATIFERLNRPAPINEKTQQPQEQARALLTWLPRWTRDSVTLRQLRVYGPRCLRARKNAIDAAEVLVSKGCLKPIKPARPDTYAWQIVRVNIISPTVAM